MNDLEIMKLPSADVPTTATGIIDAIREAEYRGYMKAVEDRPKGKWIVNMPNYESICSVCGANEADFIYGTEMWYGLGESKFCPNCGADMRERKDFQVIVNGNCTKCGKPLSGNRIFICEECEEQSKDINVRSKDEPQLVKESVEVVKDDPQTEDEILREQCRAFMGIVEQTEREGE